MDGPNILLIRRALPPFKSLWAFPGGKCRPDEPALEAAKRELLEETGLKASSFSLLKVISLLLDTTSLTLTCFKADYEEGIISPSNEIADIKWMPVAAANRLPLAPGMGEILALLDD